MILKKDATSEATVKLKIGDETRHAVAEGNSPVSTDRVFVSIGTRLPSIAEVRWLI